MIVSLSVEVEVPDHEEDSIIKLAEGRFIPRFPDEMELSLGDAVQYLFNDTTGLTEMDKLGVRWTAITNGKVTPR